MRQAMRVSNVIESVLYVADLEAAQAFYTDLLGLKFYAKEEGRHVFLRCGQQMVLLFNAEATSVSTGYELDVPTHGAAGEGHLAFAVPNSEIEVWKQRLLAAGIEIEKELQWGRTRSLYFRDPSRNSVEITSPTLWGISEETLASGA